MRQEYEMSEEDEKDLLKACKPVLYMVFGGIPPHTPQENANTAWKTLGRKLGFDGMTVKPILGKGSRFFAAEVSNGKETTAGN